MKARTIAILVAVIVVLVIVLAYAIQNEPAWGHLEYWKAHLTESPDEIYGRSGGGFDAAAELALRRSEGAPGGAPADHHRAATILYRNVMGQEHLARFDADGTPFAADVEAARRRREQFGRAGTHLAQALAGLTPAAIAAETRDHAAVRFGTVLAGDAYEGPLAPAIVDIAFEFAYEGLGVLVANDPLMGWLPGDLPPPIDRPLADAARARHRAIIATRQAAAETAAGPAPGRRADAYLELARHHKTDPQNSHDPSVQASKRAIVARLRECQGELDRLPTLDHVAAEVREGGARLSRDPRTGQPRPALTEKALATIERARAREFSMATGATDEEVLRRVWARAADPRNRAAAEKMRQAVFDGLVDSWERGLGTDVIQCVDGRISRAIGALALLDWDAANADVQKLEAHKNAIFEEARATIRRRAQKAAESGDPKERAVGLSWLATPAEFGALGALDPAAELKWTDATRAAIVAGVDAYVAARDDGVIPAHAVASVKEEAAGALD